MKPGQQMAQTAVNPRSAVIAGPSHALRRSGSTAVAAAGSALVMTCSQEAKGG
jgi:hypothetical protein